MATSSSNRISSPLILLFLDKKKFDVPFTLHLFLFSFDRYIVPFYYCFRLLANKIVSTLFQPKNYLWLCYQIEYKLEQCYVWLLVAVHYFWLLYILAVCGVLKIKLFSYMAEAKTLNVAGLCKTISFCFFFVLWFHFEQTMGTIPESLSHTKWIPKWMALRKNSQKSSKAKGSTRKCQRKFKLWSKIEIIFGFSQTHIQINANEEWTYKCKCAKAFPQ